MKVIWETSIQGRANSKYKSFEAGKCWELKWSKPREE